MDCLGFGQLGLAKGNRRLADLVSSSPAARHGRVKTRPPASLNGEMISRRPVKRAHLRHFAGVKAGPVYQAIPKGLQAFSPGLRATSYPGGPQAQPSTPKS